MLPNNKMNRINELARKSKTIGLSEEEQLEQQELRREYLDTFRSSFRNQLDNIKFADEDDNPPRKAGKTH